MSLSFLKDPAFLTAITGVATLALGFFGGRHQRRAAVAEQIANAELTEAQTDVAESDAIKNLVTTVAELTGRLNEQSLNIVEMHKALAAAEARAVTSEMRAVAAEKEVEQLRVEVEALRQELNSSRCVIESLRKQLG